MPVSHNGPFLDNEEEEEQEQPIEEEEEVHVVDEDPDFKSNEDFEAFYQEVRLLFVAILAEADIQSAGQSKRGGEKACDS